MNKKLLIICSCLFATLISSSASATSIFEEVGDKSFVSDVTSDSNDGLIEDAIFDEGFSSSVEVFGSATEVYYPETLEQYFMYSKNIRSNNPIPQETIDCSQSDYKYGRVLIKTDGTTPIDFTVYNAFSVLYGLNNLPHILQFSSEAEAEQAAAEIRQLAGVTFESPDTEWSLDPTENEGFRNIDGKTYYVDKNGNYVKGFYEIKEHVYYFDLNP